MKTVEERLHYKDASPEITVKRIKSILDEIGLEVNEEWNEPESIIGTYTVRVTIKGTNVGANGKGVSKDYARASGYAEFIERLQNDILLDDCVLGKKEGIPFILNPDEVVKSAREIVEENNAFIEFYFKNNGLDKKNNHIKAEHFLKVHRMDYIRCKENDVYLTTPFFSLKQNKIVYLPSYAYRSCYGSNGMAAGNTREEALIQGLSEIIERYVQFMVFKENISFPDIPVQYLEKYPYIKEMFLKLQNVEGYRFFLKDCSMGGKYPVAALIGIELNTGKYGIKFGCHPDYGIAMERTFTEATQGRKIIEYTACSILDFFNEGAYSSENIANTCKVGSGVYPYQLLLKKSKYKFTELPDVSELSNSEILKKMLKSIIEEGHDVLIRDVSYMGFPSYHIIIPSISEIKPCTDAAFRVYNTQCYLAKKLLNVKELDEDDCRYLSSVIKHYSNSYFENDLHRMFIGVDSDYSFPGDIAFSGALFMAAMCNVYAKEYEKALYFMKCLLKTAEINRVDMQLLEMKEYIAIKYYLEGMLVIENHRETIEYLSMFYEKEIIGRLDDLFSDTDKILIKLYDNIPRGTSELVKTKMDAKRKIEHARMSRRLEQSDIASVLL